METTEEQPNGVLVHLHMRGWTVLKPNEHYPDGKVRQSGTVEGCGSNEWQKYVKPGTPVVDTTTIPDKKRLKWAMQCPSVNPDLKGIRGAKVERDSAGISEEDLDFYTAGAHPTMRAIAILGNLSHVSVEEYCQLAKEWGAMVYIYGEEK